MKKFLLIALFPGQGQINLSVQISKKLSISSVPKLINTIVFYIYYYRSTRLNYFKNCDSKDIIIEQLGNETMKRQTKILNSIVRILVNPFNDLEFDAFRILKNVTIMGTCPSIPSNFLDDNPFVDDMIDISSKIIWIYWF
uniref:Uncharacterized protein n=1 Tax=Solanum lycopersicum TaxID=4081 RepID=A0A494G9F0_SOLLC